MSLEGHPAGSRYRGGGGDCLSLNRARGKGRASPRQVVGSLLPTFLPTSIYSPPPPTMVPGKQDPRRPSSQTTSCCPLPIQTLATKHPPPSSARLR